MQPQTAAAVLAYLSLTRAAPTTATSGFSITQILNPNPIFKSLPDIYQSAFLKYGVAPPSHVVEAVVALQSGSVTATPTTQDSEYLCPVQIGSPPQTLNLDFDTGSSDLWVFSTLLPTSESTGHKLYNNATSSTSRLRPGNTWSITYQDGSGSAGIVYGDKVVIGGVTATHQAVEAATSVSSSFATGVSDGLVGLAFKVINTVKPKPVNTFFENVAKSLPSKLFTATLKHQAPGSYDFGFLNPAKYTGSISYVPITATSGEAGFYEFGATGYSVGTGAIVSTALDAIADTGTTLLYMPSAVVSAYYKAVPRSSNSALVGGYVFPCSSTLPPLGIQIGGQTFYVPGSLLNFAPAYTLLGTAYCFGGLQVNTGLPFSIFGDVFLKAVYAVFDVGKKRMGFATQA